MPIRIATWNVHGFVGLDGRFDPERAARVLARLRPDVVAVQEVVGLDGGGDGFDFLRQAVGGTEAVAATVRRRTAGVYGQVLISRIPLRDRKVIDLSVKGREPRRAIEVLIDTPGAPTRIIATHLGLAGAERRFQIGELCGLVQARPDLDTVLMGDVNDWRGNGFAERRLSTLLGPGTRSRTFPATWPLLPLDRIWARTRGRVIGSRVVREAGLASDHLPLVMELDPAPAAGRDAAATARSSQMSRSSAAAAAPSGRV